MPTLQNAVMDHIYNHLKHGATCSELEEFADRAYNHGGGDHALGKMVQAVLTWCSEEALDICADTLPNKLVLQLMMIFKRSQAERNTNLVPIASTFHVAVEEN